MSAWTRVEEPLGRTLARTVTIAAVAGSAVGFLRGEPRLIPAYALLGLWFSLGGHYLELAFLNQLRPRLPNRRALQTAARLGVWFLGGSGLYLLMAASGRLLSAGPRRFEWWCHGGLAFMAIELVVHGVLAARRRPNFYRGNG